MRKEKIKGILTLSFIFALVIVGVVFSIIYLDKQKIYDAVSLARLSIDVNALEAVNSKINGGKYLINDSDYNKLYSELIKISELFPSNAKWSYIATNGTNENNSMLSVLTINYLFEDKKTTPGYLYDITPYPAMKKAIYSDTDIVVSSIVWDDTYNFLTRSGFAKIYNESGDVIGVLGVDLKTNHIVTQILAMVFFSIAAVMVILIASIKFAAGMGLLLTQKQYDKYIKGCK